MLDIHDGELLPTLENRRTMTRLIRTWKADIVIAHRPNDYHPDHRYTGVLVQDAAYMVTVPFFCPDTPALKKNPVFLYSDGRFSEAPTRSGPTSWCRSTLSSRRRWTRWLHLFRSSSKAVAGAARPACPLTKPI